MLRVKEGQSALLGVLFERHHRALFNFFAKLTARREIAEDLVQEVFLRMLKYRHNYGADGHYLAWMYQIARRVHFDYLRKIRHEAYGEKDDDPAIDTRLVSKLPVADQILAKREETELVRKALSRLPAEKRELLILARYQDLKYEEIARILECEIGTVKTRVFRALQDLAQIFEGLAGVRVPKNRLRNG